ncbi:unnamed protein product [Effrenium voratum]|nr:unnamed protein product [Effrenium voratum]
MAAMSDVDESGNSYFGSTYLYWLKPDERKKMEVCGVDKGLVQDLAWSPCSNEFMVIVGMLPAAMNLYSGATGKLEKSLGQSKRNTLKWNPFGRFVAVAGFGTLPGDLDFYDRSKDETVASLRAALTVDCSWFGDGRHFMAATVAPRMNEGNQITVYKYTGEAILKIDFKPDFVAARHEDTGAGARTKTQALLFAARWRPSIGKHEDRAASPPRDGEKRVKGLPTALAPGSGHVPLTNAYRPRNAEGGGAGTVAAMMRGEVAIPEGPQRERTEPWETKPVAPALEEWEIKKLEKEAKKLAEQREKEAKEKHQQALRDVVQNEKDTKKRIKELKQMLEELEKLKEKDWDELTEEDEVELDREAALRAELTALEQKGSGGPGSPGDAVYSGPDCWASEGFCVVFPRKSARAGSGKWSAAMEIRRGLAAVLALMSMGFLVRPFMELPSSNQLLLLLNLDISQPLSFQPAPAPAAAAPAPVPPGPVPVDAEDVEVATKGAEVAKAAEEAKAKEAEAAKAAKEAEAAKAAKEAEAVQAKEAEAAQAAKEAEAAKAANAAKEAEAAKAAQEAEAAKAAQEAEAAKAAQAAAAKSEPLAERLRRHAGIYEDKTKAPELKNVLLLTAANSGYLEMLVNWECFAKRLGLDWMVMSMDSKLHQHLGEDRSFQATGQEWEEAAAFNSKVGFKVISCNKIRTVLEILRSTNLDLVFSDGDNVFKSDPFLPSLSLGSMIRSGQYEYIYGRKIEPGGQRIENLKPEVYHQEPIKANTGFYYVSGSPKKQSVVNKVFEAGVSWCNRRPDMDDQENFWDALVHVRRQTARDKDYVGCFRHCNNSACAGVDDSLVFNYCDMCLSESKF